MSPSRGSPKKAAWRTGARAWLGLICFGLCLLHSRADIQNVSAAVLPRRNQDVSFSCGADCENLLNLKLATDCSLNETAEAILRVSQEVGVRWARFDASSLTAGALYKLCLNRVDDETYEDTGETVFISPIQKVHPLLLQPSSSQDLSITCVPGCTTSTEVLVALDCSSLTGAPSATLTGFRAFWSVTMDLSSLSFGQVYKVCADIDGTGVATLPVGDTGLTIRTGGATSIQVVSIMGTTNQRVPIVCSGCTAATAAYFLDTGSNCDTTERSGSYIGTAPTSISSVLLTGAGNQWEALIDASSLTTGTSYKLCIDLDGAVTELAFVDTGLTVQITSITGVVSATYNVGGVTTLDVTTDLADGSLSSAYGYVGEECSTAFSNSAGERNTVEQTVLGVVSGVLSFPLTETGLVQGKMYRACVDEDGPGSQGFIDVGTSVYVTGITAVTPNGVARATGQQLQVTCLSTVCSTDTKLYLTSSSCNTLITNGDPGVPTGDDVKRTTEATAIAVKNAVEINYWIWTLDATNLDPGKLFHICADIDGATGTMPFGDTGLQIYSSPLDEVLTEGINVAELQTVKVRCATGCSESSRAYLALRSITPSNLFVKDCDSTVTNGVIDPYGNENTAAVPLTHQGGDLWTMENIDATPLIAGRFYGLCMDMDGSVSTLGFGDTGLLVYVTGVESFTPKAIQKLFAQKLQLVCPFCNPDNDITQGYISLECDTSLYFGFNLPATTGVNSPTNRVPGPGGDTSEDATQLYIDARELDLGGVYHLCIDLDGTNAKMAMGDTGFVVYVTSMSALKPWGILPAADQIVVMTCPDGCTDGVSAAYVGSDCDHTVSNGEMTAVTGERTPHAVFSKPADLDTDDYQVTIDAQGMISGKHYLFCTDLDGNNSYLPWGNTDLPMYISPISQSAYYSFYSSATSELRLTCDGCTVDSRVYILNEQSLCDHLEFGGVKTGDGDQTTSVATTPLGGSAGIVLAFVDTTALTAGYRYRICLDLDGVATDYAFGDTGIQVYLASVTDSGGTIFPATGQVIPMTCATGCSTDTMAYLAISCDSTVTDGSIAANGVSNTAAVNLAGASPSFTATIDASGLQPGRHYTLCTDLDGSTGTMAMGANDFSWYVTGVSGLPHYKFGLKQQKGVGRSINETIVLTCTQCTNASSAYLGITCDATDFDGYHETPSSTYSGTGSVELDDLGSEGWGATFDTSTLTLGINYQLCLDLDGTAQDLAFGFTGQTIYSSPVVSTANVAVTKTADSYLELTCESADACPSTAMAYLAESTTECDIATSAYIFGSGSSRTAAAVLEGDTSTTTRSQEVVAADLEGGASYQICLDMDGTESSVAGGTTIDKTFGWTGLTLFLSTVTAADPPRIDNAASQVLTLTCINGNAGCPQSTASVYLTSEGRCEDLTYDGAQTVANTSRTAAAIVYQPDAVTQAVDLDASTLTVGDLYELCIDNDGVATGVAFGNTAVKVFVTAPISIAVVRYLPRTVEPTSDQYVVLECNSGCSTASTAYLALTCDTSANTGKSAVAGSNTASVPLVQESSNWKISFDATGLAEGYYYSVCIDMDGAATTQSSGDSGVLVYINPLTPAMAMALPAASGQVLSFTCPSCTSTSGGYLATSCDIENGFPGFAKTSGVDPEVDGNGAVNTESSFFVESASTWDITLDTSLLSQGSYYVLCTDMDGGPTSGAPESNPLKIGEALEVYITSIQSLQTDTILATSAEQILFTCESCNLSVSTTEIYLADACDTLAYSSVAEIQGSRTASVAISESGGLWAAVVDASKLSGGQDYRICVDQDGAATVERSGDAQLAVSVSGIVAVAEKSLNSGPTEVLSLQCSVLGGCTAGTSVVYLAKSCDTSLSTGIVVASGEDYTSSFAISGSGTSFTVQVNTSRLERGRHYKVCADMDGVGSLRMVDTLNEVFISPVVPGHPKFEGPWPNVRRATEQALTFPCTGCSNYSEGWLAEECGNASDPNLLRTPAFNLEGQDVNWTLPIDATSLTTGNSYNLCLDLDGSQSDDLRPGNVLSFLIYVTGVTAIDPIFVLNSSDPQSITVTCPEGCSTDTEISLAETCGVPLLTATLSASNEVTFDAGTLLPGSHYRLCTDLDGSDGSANLTVGDTGLYVYVTGVAEKAPRSTVGPGLSMLQLACSGGCSEMSSVYITTASTCDDTWTVNGVMPEAADRTAAATFSKMLNDASDAGNVYWEVPIRTSVGVHTFGVFYRICADLDGMSPDQIFGETGLQVYVSPVSAVRVAYRVLESSSGLVAAPGQTLVVTCPIACNTSSEVHLAERCDSTPTSPAVNTTLPAVLQKLTGYLDEEWVAEVDASNLQPGAAFELCIDVDGLASTDFPMGGSNFEVYVSPVTALDGNTLQQLAGEKLTVACETCTTDTAIYLGTTCAASSATAVITETTTEGLWEATFDASTLAIGNLYELCADLDGFANPYRPMGDTGLSIYISPVAGVVGAAAIAQVAESSTELRIACSSVSSCGSGAEAFLGTECFDVGDLDPDAAPVEARFSTTVPLQEVPGFPAERLAVIPTDNLEAGRYYRLCIDADGTTFPQLPGDTGVTVYMTPVVSGPVTTILYGAATEVEVEGCVEFCTNISQAHLSESCDPPVGSGRQSDPRAVNLQLRANRWWLQVSSAEAANLVPFRTYHLCLDLDGDVGPLKLGDTGREIFISGIAAKNVTANVYESLYTLELSCLAGCDTALENATQVRLAAQCDTSESDVVSRITARSTTTGSAPLVPSAAGWSADLDVSTLRPGQVYRLCADGDGPGPLFEGDAGWKIYASPISLLTTAVAGGSGWRTLQLFCNGCSEQTQVRLDLDCEAESLMIASTIQRISASLWTTSISMSGLTVGQSYRLCSDLDGGSDLPWGDTTFTVYVSPIISLTSYMLRTGGLQTLEMHCEGNCSSLSIGLLAEDGNCSSGTSPAMFLQVSTLVWSIQLDTTGLTVGARYSLCVDIDGDGPLPLGPTGLEVFATLVASATPVTISAAAGQVLTLTCDVACDAFQVHLAEVCRGTGLVPAEVPGEPGKTLAYTAVPSGATATVTIDTSAIRPARSYTLCVDHGSGAGDSGLRVYLAGVADVQPKRIQAAAAQKLSFTCEVCSSRADNRPVRLAGGTAFSGRVELLHASEWGTICNKNFTDTEAMVVCNQLGLREGAVLGALPGSGSIWLSAVTCDGSESGLGQCESTWGSGDCTHDEDVSITCSDQQIDPTMCCSKDSQAFLLQADGTLCTDAGSVSSSVRSASAYLDGVVSMWSASIDAASLLPGSYYTICVDTDGSVGALSPGAVDSIYISPLDALGITAILQAASQTLQLSCSACTDETSVFLAEDCNTPETTAALLVAGSATIDASTLQLGHAYAVCMDLDSTSSNFSAGDSGFVAYVSGITAADSFVYPLASFSFNVTCAGCSNTTQIFLAEEDCQASQNSRANLENAGDEEWTADLDGQSLHAGKHYMLCVDIDGANVALSGGPTGFDVFVSPVIGYEHPSDDGAFRAETMQQIRLTCSGCSRAAEAFLATSCEDPLATATPRSIFHFDGLIWSVDVDASGLLPGGRYRLCVDMDGQTTTLISGDTGLDIYLSAAQEDVPLMILPLPEQTAGPFTCEVCSAATRAYLGAECPGHLTGLLVSYSSGDVEAQELTNGTALPGKYEREWFKSSGDGALSANPDGAGWVVTLDAENLTAGYRYRLCLDVDGFGLAMGFGDSGVKVFTAPVQTAELSVASEPGTVLTLSCPLGALGAVGFLSTTCDSSVLAGDVLSSISGSGSLEDTSEAGTCRMVLDTSQVQRGRQLNLCVGVPGNGLALGGLSPPGVGNAQVVVFVTPVSASSTVLGHQVVLLGMEEQVTLQCSDCTSSSEVFLTSSECFMGIAQENVSFSTTVATSLASSGSGAWSAVFDVTMLAAGASYRICVDLDGLTTATLPAGDSGQLVWISPILSVQQAGIADGRAQVPLVCSGCTSATSAYLADDCQTGALDVVSSSSRDPPVQLDFGSGTWSMTPGISGLELYRHYDICIDLDGTATSFESFFSGHSVFLSDLVLAGNDYVFRNEEQDFQLSCQGCSSMAKAYLATHCGGEQGFSGAEDATPKSASLAVRGEAPDWQLSFDATSLEAGHYYSLCWQQYEMCGPAMAEALAGNFTPDTETATFVPPNVTDEPFTESNALPTLHFPNVPGPVIPGLRAEFFIFSQDCSFQDLQDLPPNVTRFDKLVDYEPGNESLPADPWKGLTFANDFAARWTGYLLISSPGTYLFEVEAADGYRLSVDDDYVLEHPGCHPVETMNGSTVLTEGFHPVTLEYFEKSDASGIVLRYMGSDTLEELKVIPYEVWWNSGNRHLQVGTDTKFFNLGASAPQSCDTFVDLHVLVPDVQRNDQQINYGSSTSWTGLSFSDHFAVSWAGFIVISRPGLYTFQVELDDGARLLVEKNLLVASTSCGAQTLTASLAMAQGYHYFELEYFEVTGHAFVILSYQGPDSGEVMTVVPSSVLRYPQDISMPPTEGQVQLENLTFGRLEIYHDGQWGTVCDDNFGDDEALVVCRQLGFSIGRSLGFSVPEGAETIWMDEVDCIGNETRLDQCSFSNWGEHDCSHAEDVGVDCTQEPVLATEGDVRLSGGNIGRLDIYHEGTWGTVCSSGFSDEEVRVACRQLGYCCGVISASPAPVGTGPIWLADLQCVGYEQRLDQCGVTAASWDSNSCSRNQDVAIHCLDGASCLASGAHLYLPGDTGLKIYVSGVNLVQPNATPPDHSEFLLTCPSCSSDTTVYLAERCTERPVVTSTTVTVTTSSTTKTSSTLTTSSTSSTSTTASSTTSTVSSSSTTSTSATKTSSTSSTFTTTATSTSTVSSSSTTRTSTTETSSTSTTFTTSSTSTSTVSSSSTTSSSTTQTSSTSSTFTTTSSSITDSTTSETSTTTSTISTTSSSTSTTSSSTSSSSTTSSSTTSSSTTSSSTTSTSTTKTSTTSSTVTTSSTSRTITSTSKTSTTSTTLTSTSTTLTSTTSSTTSFSSTSSSTTSFTSTTSSTTLEAGVTRTEEALLENSTSLSQWTTYLNTTDLLLGRYFRLCVDADGAGIEVDVGDSGHEVYLQLLSVLTPVVLAAPAQRVDVRASDPYHHNFQMFLSVAAEGCGVELASAQPPWVKRTNIAVPIWESGGGLWGFEVDASGLEIGDHAVVCEDYDGDMGPLRPGPAGGPPVYVSGAVVTTSETIRRRPLQYIYLECAAGCDTRSWGFLATDCDDPLPGKKTAGAYFQGVAPSFNLTLDATDLEAGYRYLLCTDLDGPTAPKLKAGPAVGTGPFVAGIELIRTRFIQAAESEVLELICSADCRGFVSGVSTLFLSSTSCDVEPGSGNETTSVSVLSGLPPTFSATVNASGLETGLSYRVCVDLDGAGPEKVAGDSLFEVYISGVISVVSPPAVRASSDAQPVVLQCLPDQCSTASTAFLSAGCSIADSQGPPLRTAEVSFMATNNATLWELNFSLAGLTMGTRYRICVDIDGVGLEFPIGESGLSLYVAPLGPSLPPASTIRKEMNQEVLVRCVAEPCRSLLLPGSTATAFLAAADVRCSESQALTPHSTLRSHSSLSDAWLVSFDARSLDEGRTYRLCIDADGSRTTLEAGDSLVNVFISPLKEAGFTAMPEEEQQVKLPCVSACDAALAAPFAYFVAKEPEDPVGCNQVAPFDAPVSLSSGQASQVVASFNSSDLIAGYHYELCLGAAYRVLDDEPKAGMSGAVIFVSPFTAAAASLPEPQGGFAVQTAPGQQLVFSCSSTANCSTDTQVFLAADRSSSGLLTAAGTALTPAAALTPMGQEWYATVDASGLTAGKYYLLCVDLSGLAPAGCTDFMVFASSLSASTQTISFEGFQLFSFSCASGCTSSSTAYLSRNCSTGYAGPSTLATSMVAPSNGNLLSAVLQVDTLISGFRYQMCVDLDGPGALQIGPSGVVVYVSGVSGVFPSFLTGDSGEQQVILQCGEDPCRPSRGRLKRGSCGNNSASEEFVTATEWRSLSAGVNGGVLNVLTDGLEAGAHYLLCMEMEADSDSFLANETLDEGDSGFTLYVSPLQGFEPLILRPAQQEVLMLNCSSSSNCTSKTEGFLSQSCGFAGQLAPVSTDMADGTAAASLESGTEADAWRLTLDASQLIPGQHYKLCLDLDGDSLDFQPGQSSAAQIFISPLVPSDVQTVKIIQDQTMTLQCVTGAACSTISVWYLTNSSCGEPGDSSLQPEAMSPIQANGQLVSGSQAGYWLAQLDGGLLEAGVHYRLCLDLDGSGPLWPGDTNIEVYAAGILSLAPEQIFISATEQLNLTCAETGCPSEATLWLASECETPLTSVKPLVSIDSTKAAVEFDTTSLQAGQWLKLCSDLDGAGSLRHGSTGLYVYISGILAVNDPWMQTWVGRLTLDCAISACNSGEAFLALDCGRSGQAIQTPSAQLRDAPYEEEEYEGIAAERKAVVLDLQNLVAGVHYRLCTDLDGAGPFKTFYSGFDVYVTNLRQATQDLVVKRQVQSVLLECDPSGCPPTTAEAFVAENCSTTTPPLGARLVQSPSGTLRRIATVDASTLSSRWYHLCIDVDGQASSGLHGGPVGNVFVSPIGEISPHTLSVAGEHDVEIQCSTCTEETQVFLALSCSLQNASNLTALSSAGNAWTATLTTYHTEPGLFYQLCVVMENVTGPSGEALFVAPDVDLQEEAVLHSEMQLISLDCSGGCASLAHVSLATECFQWDTMQQVPVVPSNVISSPAAPTTHSGGIFLANLDASTVPAGQNAHLCVGSQDTTMGDSGLSVFVSPVSVISTSVIFNAPAQSLRLNCTGCSTMSEVYLALNCSTNASSATNRTPAAPLVASAGGYQWAAQLDATHLEPGIRYEICIDLDGEDSSVFPSGKSMWQVYASAFSSPGHFSLPLSPTSQLKVPCLGCSTAQGFLADSCPSRNLIPEDAMNHSNASRFPVGCLGGSEAATDATSFETSGQEFVLQLDTCSLTPGSHLPLCTDMDGFNSRLEIGDSGIEVYVSPLTSAVGPARLVKGQSSVLTVICTGCISGLTTAQLAIECDESPNAVPLAISPNSTNAVQLQEGSEGFTASFDTRGLSSGREYQVCLDLDGPGTLYRAGDSGIAMYLTAIASISFDEGEESEPVQSGRRLASVTAGRILELVMLCLPGGGGCGAESEAFLSLIGECTPILPAQQLQKLPSYYGLAYDRFGVNLSTASLPAGYTYEICVDADGPGIIFPAGETGYTIYISPVRLAVSWGSVLRLVCEPGGCSSITSSFLATDCASSAPSMTKLSAIAGYTAPWPEVLYLSNSSDTTAAELWELPVEASFGLPMRLCLDVDDNGPMPVGDARGIYTSSVQQLFTHGVSQGLDEVLTLGCHSSGGCSEESQAYLAKQCDIYDLDAGAVEVLGERTASSFLVPDNSSEAVNETEVFSVHLRTDGLPAGRHYSFCMDIDGFALAMPTGDTLYQVYLSPVREVEPQPTPGHIQLRFNCSDCSQLSEGFLALDCYEAALALQPLPRASNSSEDSDVPPGEVDVNFTEERYTRSNAMIWDASGGNWLLEISTETLLGGLRYRFCMDLDGAEWQYLVGDTGLSVFISPVTSVQPLLVFAGNSSLTLLCQRGGCHFLSHCYLARDCQAPPAPSQCSYKEEDSNETNESNGTNESNFTDLVDPQLGPPIQVESSPLSVIDALGSGKDFFGANLDLTCTKPGRYRLCIIGQEETTFGAIATHIEDSGFNIDVA